MLYLLRRQLFQKNDLKVKDWEYHVILFVINVISVCRIHEINT